MVSNSRLLLPWDHDTNTYSFNNSYVNKELPVGTKVSLKAPEKSTLDSGSGPQIYEEKHDAALPELKFAWTKVAPFCKFDKNTLKYEFRTSDNYVYEIVYDESMECLVGDQDMATLTLREYPKEK